MKRKTTCRRLWTAVTNSRVLQEEEATLALGYPWLSTHREGGSKGHPGQELTHPEASDPLRCDCVSVCFSSVFSEAFLVLDMTCPLPLKIIRCAVHGWAVPRDTKTSPWNQGFSEASLNERRGHIDLAESSWLDRTRPGAQTSRTGSGGVVVCEWGQMGEGWELRTERRGHREIRKSALRNEEEQGEEDQEDTPPPRETVRKRWDMKDRERKCTLNHSTVTLEEVDYQVGNPFLMPLFSIGGIKPYKVLPSPLCLWQDYEDRSQSVVAYMF